MKDNKQEKGFTLIELVIALAIVSVTVYGASGLLSVMIKSLDVDRERIVMTNLAACRIEEWQAHKYDDIRPGMNFAYFKRAVSTQTIDGYPGYKINFSSITTTVNAVEKVSITPTNTVIKSGYNVAIDLHGSFGRTGTTGGTPNQWYAGPADGGTEPGVIVATITCPGGVKGMLKLELTDTIDADNNGGKRGENIYLNDFLEKVCQSFTGGETYSRMFTQDETASGEIRIRIEQTRWYEDGVGWHEVAYYNAGNSENPDAVLASINFAIIEGFTENDAFSPYRVNSEVISTYGESEVTGLVPAWKIWVTVTKPGSNYRSIEMATTIVK